MSNFFNDNFEEQSKFVIFFGVGKNFFTTPTPKIFTDTTQTPVLTKKKRADSESQALMLEGMVQLNPFMEWSNTN